MPLDFFSLAPLARECAEREISGVAAESRTFRWRVAALSATVVGSKSASAAATAATVVAAPATPAESLAKESAKGIQGVQLARQEAAQAAAIPATAQQRALPGSQEDRSCGAERADASRAGGLRDGDAAEQSVQSADRGGHCAALRHQVDRLLEQIWAGLPAVRQVGRRSLQRQHQDQLHSR